MTTVFLSGSRTISRLGEDVRQRLQNMIDKGLTIITGDANGADKAMQAFLAEQGYSRVTIYYVGEAPRNNVGCWPVQRVAVEAPARASRDFYAQKDHAMAKIADLGFVLWDGKSAGSLQNILWLLGEGKKAVVYFGPDKRFYTFKAQDEVVELLIKYDDDFLDDIERKIALPEELRKANRRQTLLDFQ
jgi:hypothetical protein